jgi:hypothetical protein
MYVSSFFSTRRQYVADYQRVLRRGRDSNPRYPFGVHTLSKRTSSATRAPLRFYLECKCIKIIW